MCTPLVTLISLKDAKAKKQILGDPACGRTLLSLRLGLPAKLNTERQAGVRFLDHAYALPMSSR